MSKTFKEQVEELNKSAGAVIKSADEFVTTGTAKIIGPAATKARELINRLKAKLTTRDPR